MSKRVRNFIMISAIAILGLVILPNEVFAYGEQIEPIKNLTDIYFYKKNITTTTALNNARQYITNNCSSYDSYAIYSTNTSANLNKIHFYCFNKADLKDDFLKSEVSLNRDSTYYYANHRYLDNSNFKSNVTYKYGVYSSMSSTSPTVSTKNSNSNSLDWETPVPLSYNEFILPYLESNLEIRIYYKPHTVSSKIAYNTVIKNDVIYNEDDYFMVYSDKSFYIPSEYILRETYDGSVYSLESFNFDFDLQDLYDDEIFKPIKFKIEVSNYNNVETIIENTSYDIYYRNNNTGFYSKTDMEYFPLEYEYVEEEHSLYLIFSNNLNKMLQYYDGVRFSVNFKNSNKNILNIYSNVEYGTFELISSSTENFIGYQKVLISSSYKDYIISASESKSFNIIAKRENVLNVTEGDLIVFKYDFSTPIYSNDTYEILNEGITLSPYLWGSYNGTYNEYIEFYVTLDYLNNKIVLIRNNHEKDFYIWVPYDVNISPVKSDGSFDLVTPEDGKVDGNTSSNNKDYTNLPSIGDENFFSYMKKGISSFTGNISYIFQSVSNIFNGFSEGLQTFFITIFFLSLALFIIRFLF